MPAVPPPPASVPALPVVAAAPSTIAPAAPVFPAAPAGVDVAGAEPPHPFSAQIERATTPTIDVRASTCIVRTSTPQLESLMMDDTMPRYHGGGQHGTS